MSKKEEDIIQSATKLFSEFGYHAVGIDTIIAESNVAKMTFYKYFPSKELLIEGVLKRRDEDLQAGILRTVESCRTPMAKLKAIFDWYENWFCGADFHGCMFIKASEEFPRGATRVREIIENFKSWLIELIKEILQKAGAANAAVLAQHIVVVLDGLTVKFNMDVSVAHTEMASNWKLIKKLVQLHIKDK